MPGHRGSQRDQLVQIAYASDSSEGQMIAGLLEAEGIDCLQLLGARGDQIARPAALGERGSGPRRVVVRTDDAERARNVIERRRSEVDDHQAREAPDPSGSR